MRSEDSFFRTVCHLAVPVALQSMLQSSFSVIDQIMIGQLGSVSIAGVGMAGKFSSIYSSVISGVGAVAGIMIAQYMGQEDPKEVRRSFYINLLVGAGVAAVFTVFCMLFPAQIMGLYTTDAPTRAAAGEYLAVIAGTFVPMAGATMLSAQLRCMDRARLPLYASIAAALVNTGLNYILIFGKCGFSAMGAKGAAIATVVSQFVNFAIMLCMMPRHTRLPVKMKDQTKLFADFQWKQYVTMFLPILACEMLWSLGENVYAMIYGHIGTDSSAAMTLINPVQGLVIGALCGLSQAAGIIIGKKLGSREYDEAYEASKKLVWYGLAGSVILSVLVVLTSGAYVKIYQVESQVKLLTRQILFAYALVAPFKVLNMILGGGVIRSGGKTSYVLIIDLIGTWGFGVPLGLLAAFVWKLSIPYVYFLLSLEECVRFVITIVVFRKRNWMQSLRASA